MEIHAQQARNEEDEGEMMADADYPGRNYKREAAAESQERKNNRIKRHKARRQMIKEGKAAVGDGKVVNHKKALSKGGSEKRNNLEMQRRKDSDTEGGYRQPKSGKARGGRH